MKKRASSCAGRPVTARPEAAQAFYELYLAMLSGAAEGRAAGDENLRVVFDRASDRVCKSCVLCAQCWQKDYVTTLAALNDVTQPCSRAAARKCRIFPIISPRAAYICPSSSAPSTAHSSRCASGRACGGSRRKTAAWLARQYAGITDILRQLGAEVTQDVTAQPMVEKQIRRYAAAFGWIDGCARCATRRGG